MNFRNYNWNISTLESLQKSDIYVFGLYPDPLHNVDFFRLGVVRVDRKKREKNFRYISTLITIEIPDKFGHYYSDNEHNKVSIYFYNW